MADLRRNSCVETVRSIRRRVAAPKLTGGAISTAARRVLPLLLVLCVGMTSAGCYRFTVQSKNATAAEFQGKTVHSYLWNLVDLDPVVVAENCGSKDLDTLRAKTNYIYMSVAFLTLGAWVPMKVEWRCAK
jgi:hypothetical protein